MEPKDKSVVLYTAQREIVVETLSQKGVYHVKWEYIRQKYGQIAHVFLSAYQWYALHASSIVAKPTDADSAVWAFAERMDVDNSGEVRVLTLEVPVDEAVFFAMTDWTKILNMGYVGTPEEEAVYRAKLEQHGVKNEADVVTTGFYPLLKREVQASWDNLFRHHERILSGEADVVPHIQAGLWQIRAEWIRGIEQRK